MRRNVVARRPAGLLSWDISACSFGGLGLSLLISRSILVASNKFCACKTLDGSCVFIVSVALLRPGLGFPLNVDLVDGDF
jgi:hypothetical protein